MWRPVFAVVLLAASLGGCASTRVGEPDPRDPWERVNRATFAFNDAVDRAIAKPAARGYKRFVPRVVRTGVSNFFSNLEQPLNAVNNLLQGKLDPAANDLGRFVLNTTLGLGGLFDPASPAGFERNEEDFGQTFGKWGASPGPYLVLPFMGPSTVRDGVGSIADWYADPTSYIEDDGLSFGLKALELLDSRARLLDAEAALEGAYDRYRLVRSAYLQRREFLVSDGELAADDEWLDPEELDAELEEEAGAEESGQPAEPPPKR